MNLKNKQYVRIIAWAVVLCGLMVAGCQLFIPRYGWDKKKGPLVAHKNFPGDCSLCHVPDRWDKLRDDFSYDHEKETGYRLEGAHSAAACLRCHNDRGPVQAYVVRGCGGCHQDPHASSLGMDCERCHGPLSWAPIGLVAEHARTRFPLFGSHAIATCESCHEGAAAGQFRGASTQCEVCHQEDLAQATSPNHVANGWVRDCQDCHGPVGWAGASIRHDFFALSGGHGGLDCAQCHVGGVYSSLSTDCYSCHSANYQTAPNHVAQNYTLDCQQCHNINDWNQAFFDHTQFALTGGHSGLDCAQCHAGGVFTSQPTDCYSCHSANYQAAPGHIAGNFSQNCEQCHATTAWLPAAFDHTLFPLTAGHAGLACSQCHASGVYTGLPSDCNSCHSANYQTAPNHVAGNYPRNCEQCHGTAAWLPATFDHAFFSLTGGHAGLDCSQCHGGGVYTGLSTDCFSCHSADYQAAPDHANLGFPTDCAACHSITAWTPSSFRHSFPLSGPHNRSCTECHTTGTTQTFTCLECHEHSRNKMADKHSGVSGYSYASPACVRCHPNGRG